jgi:hypothetical protein
MTKKIEELIKKSQEITEIINTDSPFSLNPNIEKKRKEKLDEAEASRIGANLQAKRNQHKSTIQVAELKRQMAELNQKIKASGWEREVLTEKNSSLDQENTDLKQKNVDLEGSLTEKDTQISEVVEEWNKSRTRNRTLRRQLKEKDENWTEEVEELATEKKALGEKNGALAVELGKERIKNKKLTTDKEKFQELAEHYKWKYDLNKDKKEKLLKKLQTIKAQQKVNAEQAQQKKVCQTLIKWQGIPNSYTNNDKLERALTDTANSFIDTIADTQNYLGVNDLTQITTAHPMPEGKTLRDLIEFYKSNKDKAPTSPSQPQIITRLEPGEPNETLIVNQIITECDLGLDENSSLTQVIERIQKLIKVKPPVVIKPVNQSQVDTPFGENCGHWPGLFNQPLKPYGGGSRSPKKSH